MSRIANRSGMTLVELLVVLVVLASLAISVAVSSSGLVDGAKAERTRRQGEAMRDALTRAEGLNLARDMGRMPDPAQPGELGLFVSRAFRRDVQRIDGADAGPLDPDNPGDLRFAPVYRQYGLLELKDSITNNPARFSDFAALFNVAAISNLWSGATIGGGWRGPYCTAAAQDEETLLLLDPYGGCWDFTADGAMRSLVSYGLDRMKAGGTAGTNDWRNVDLTFAVCTTNDTGELLIEVAFPEDVENAATNAVSAYCIAPCLHSESENLEADGVTCRMLPASFKYGGGAGGTVAVHGLSSGTWAVCLAAKTDGADYVAPVRIVTVGQGMVKFRATLMRQTSP